MKIKPYWDYFKYVMEHKKNVFLECREVNGMFWRGITHDLSKLRPSEFFPYARYFYIDKEKYKAEFDAAWQLHYRRNKHHWDNHCVMIGPKKERWVCFDMDADDISEMICDWKAMGRKFGDTAQEYYLNNYQKIRLSRDTRFCLESRLGLLDQYGAPISEGHQEYWMTLEELASLAYDRTYFEAMISPLIKKYPKVDIYKAITGKDD